MLAPRHVIFTATDGALLDAGSRSWTPAEDALGELERMHVPLVLSTTGTRAELEPLRRKIEHKHPFITESGGGLFLPDGYFSLALEGAGRVARYFCAPFGHPYAETIEALEKISDEAEASVVGYAQMSSRELSQNTGQPLREAELARQREFSERFFFAGNVDSAATRFLRVAAQQKWDAIPGHPFWELRSGNDQGRALRYLMRLFRTSMRSRLNSVGIGSAPEDLSLLLAADHKIVLPGADGEIDPFLAERLPNSISGAEPGAAGWNQAVLEILKTR